MTALLPGGGYAEYAVVHETQRAARPRRPEPRSRRRRSPRPISPSGPTCSIAAACRAGETFLVHGGTSGIGVTAILLAKAFGAKVIATVGSADKAKACLELGADVAINYREEDFVAATMAATDGQGADLILDMVGGDYTPRNYAAARVDGRIVQIAFLHGPKVELDLRPLMMKRLTHTGSTLRPRSPAEKAVIAAALHEKVWPLLEAGRCKPVIDSVFALEDVAKAHARMESSAHVGKIVLTM